MGLPNTASRTLYRVREAEVPILSAAITVMKKISFRSILLRPSDCARPIRSPDLNPLCYRWDRPILWATLTVETKRKPSRILIRKFGESHQKPCSGSRGRDSVRHADRSTARRYVVHSSRNDGPVGRNIREVYAAIAVRDDVVRAAEGLPLVVIR